MLQKGHMYLYVTRRPLAIQAKPRVAGLLISLVTPSSRGTKTRGGEERYTRFQLALDSKKTKDKQPLELHGFEYSASILRYMYVITSLYLQAIRPDLLLRCAAHKRVLLQVFGYLVEPAETRRSSDLRLAAQDVERALTQLPSVFCVPMIAVQQF